MTYIPIHNDGRKHGDIPTQARSMYDTIEGMNKKPANIASKQCQVANKTCLQPYHVTMSKHNFSATELRILSCIMLKLKDRQIENYNGKLGCPGDEGRNVVIENAMVTLDENYAYVKEAFDSLLKKVITITTKRGWKMFRLINKAEYVNNNQRIEVEVGRDVYPELVALGKAYTNYSLEFLFKTKSAYAIRWYMLGCHWANKGKFYISISTIREIFAIKDDEHKTIFNFKRRVIEGPLAIVNKESDIVMTVTKQHKERREIIGFSFKVTSKNIEIIDSSESTTEGAKRNTKGIAAMKQGNPLEIAMDQALGMIEENGDEGARAKTKFQDREPNLYHTMCQWKVSVHEENEKKEVTTNPKLLQKRFMNYLKKNQSKANS